MTKNYLQAFRSHAITTDCGNKALTLFRECSTEEFAGKIPDPTGLSPRYEQTNSSRTAHCLVQCVWCNGPFCNASPSAELLFSLHGNLRCYEKRAGDMAPTLNWICNKRPLTKGSHPQHPTPGGTIAASCLLHLQLDVLKTLRRNVNLHIRDCRP